MNRFFLFFAFLGVIVFSANAQPVVASGNCGAQGSNLKWTLYFDSTFTVNGIGNMADYVFVSQTPWYPYQTYIKTAVIGDSVTSIGYGAFSTCSNLASVTIGNSITTIVGGTFGGCTSLSSVTIPNSVETIGSYVFQGCTGLDSIIIPNSVKSIGNYAFYGCSGLTSITIPNSVTSGIGNYTFTNCSSLTSVIIGDSVTWIGQYAFRNCTSLNSVVIGNSVTLIGSYAFRNCSSLTSVTIGNSVTNISGHAFEDCSSLTSVIIPDGVTDIGDSAFLNCTSLDSVTIGNSVKFIGKFTFSNCDSLKSITIPNSVKSIRTSAFQNCRNLTLATIGNAVDSIGLGAFRFCDNLTSVTIGKGIKFIGESAFSNCFKISSITIYATTPPKGDGGATFQYVPTNIPIYVPCGRKPAYQNDLFWGNFWGFSNFIELDADTTFISDTAYSGTVYTRNGFIILANTGVYYRVVNSCNVLRLTLSVITDYSATICQGVSYTDNNFTNLVKDSVYYCTYSNVDGSDSIVCLTLSVTVAPITNYSAIICQGASYTDNHFTNLTVTGTYYDTLQNINGCDSIIELTLTVKDIPIVSGFRVEKLDNNFVISWFNTPSLLYEIYRNELFLDAVSSGGRTGTYIDSNLVDGTTYCYKIRTIDGDCEGEFSDTICEMFNNDVGIVETDNYSSLRVYPNPAKNELIIENEQLKIENIEIYNVMGQLLQSKIVNLQSKIEIDVSHLASGIYSLKIQTGNSVITQKVIKN